MSFGDRKQDFKMRKKVLFLLLILSLANAEHKDVVLNQGVVRGYDADADGVFSFHGIPYATAPTGEDRYKEPLPPRSWNGILNATNSKLICYQGSKFNPSSVKTFQVYDCLVVNVYVPKNTNETNLPVLVLVHGGAFQFGNGNQMFPGAIASKGLIAVTFNYRVSLQGFLCLNNEFAPGNAGMKDMIAALKWIKENIAKFGGDPDNITLTGNSSGSCAVELVLLSPMSKGLLKRALLESGSILLPLLMDNNPITMAEKYANQYGTFTNETVDKLESFYRSRTDEQLKLPFDSYHKNIGFLPCVETHNLTGVEKFLPEAPIDILRSGNYDKIPIVTGFTSDDGLEFFVKFFGYKKSIKKTNLMDIMPTNIHIHSKEHELELIERIESVYFPTGEKTTRGVVNFFTDAYFIYPQYASARLHARNGVPVYLYVVTYNGTVNLPPTQKHAPFLGPGHAIQSLYVYDYNDKSIYNNLNDQDIVFRNKLRNVYYSFFKNGNPIPEYLNIDWPAITTNSLPTFYFGEEFYLGELPLRERIECWDQIYEYKHDYNPR